LGKLILKRRQEKKRRLTEAERQVGRATVQKRDYGQGRGSVVREQASTTKTRRRERERERSSLKGLNKKKEILCREGSPRQMA